MALKNSAPQYVIRFPREGKAIATVTDEKEYLYLNRDSDGRKIYTLKKRSGFYYALADGMKIAWRVDAVKPAMVMDEKYKKPQRNNVIPVSIDEPIDGAIHHRIKLKETSIVFELKAQNLNLGQIGRQVGLSVSQVSRILSGRSRSSSSVPIN